MQVKHLPLSQTGLRSRILQDYVSGDSFLKPFYSHAPALKNFAAAIIDREKFPVNRSVLVNELSIQHQEFNDRYPQVSANIESLKDSRTFTVTTGHQLCIAGGPLFFLYKILTTIQLASELNARYKDYYFVPVYWMATEDHDFEEIAPVNVAGEILKWEHTAGDATGRLDTKGLETIGDALQHKLGHFVGGAALLENFKAAYINSDNLSTATRRFVLSYFGEDGLLVLDADRPALKQLFSPVIIDELKNHSAFSKVSATNDLLKERYTLQVNPREINLFYLKESQRKRLISTGDKFEVLETGEQFSETEILDLVKVHPERFSPNVVLRPLYQEMILPNLAYIGGPAETAYWLQLKSLFEYHSVFYPVLVPRNHGLILSLTVYQRWQKEGYNLEELFLSSEELFNRFIKSLPEAAVVTSELTDEINRIYWALEKQVGNNDVTLEPVVRAQLHKALKGLQRIEQKHQSALKRRHSVFLNRIQSVVDIVNPSGVPQERVEGFTNMMAHYDLPLLKILRESSKPFAESITIVLT